MLQTRRPSDIDITPGTTQIALAWNVTVTGNREIAWKNGSGAGFRSFIGYDRAARVGVVGLINVQSDIGVDDIGLHLLGAPIPVDVHVPKVHTQVAIDPALLDSYVGRYRFSEHDILTVTREGNRLFCQEAHQDKLQLHPEGEKDFFLEEVDAQVTFESHGDQPAATAVWHQWGQDQVGQRIR